jgi:hypothetical protein
MPPAWLLARRTLLPGPLHRMVAQGLPEGSRETSRFKERTCAAPRRSMQVVDVLERERAS